MTFDGIRGGAPASYEPPTLTALDGGSYLFSWTPRDSGDFVLDLTLAWTASDGAGAPLVVSTRAVRARVLFCEHFLQAGQTLRDVAAIYRLSWQALFALNPEIANPRVVRTLPEARTWQCGGEAHSAQACEVLGALAGSRVRIGRVLTLGAAQVLSTPAIVQGYLSHMKYPSRRTLEKPYETPPPW